MVSVVDYRPISKTGRYPNFDPRLKARRGRAHQTFRMLILLSYFLEMAPQVGFEPTTDRLTADCSTTELLRINIRAGAIPLLSRTRKRAGEEKRPGWKAGPKVW